MDTTREVTGPAGYPARSWWGAGAAHAWDRFDGMWAVLFYVTLGVPTVGALLDAGATTSQRLVIAGGSAVVAGARELAVRWILRELPEGADLHFDDRGHFLVGLAWAVATLAGMAVLVDADQSFFFTLYGLFPQAFTVLPRNWAIGFAGTLTPAVLLAENGTDVLESGGFFTAAIGSALVALVLGVFIHSISRESQQRHDAIGALEAAQVEAEALLAATLAVSRARTVHQVVEAVGECLSGNGVDAVALWTPADPPELLAQWSRPAPTSSVPAPGSASATVVLPSGGVGDDVELAVSVNSRPPPTGPAERTLETLATSCGLALANLRLIEAARSAGVGEERARLAREIHDTLAQGFVSVLTQLEAVGGGATDLPEEIAVRLERVRSIAQSSLGEARRSVEALRPEPLEGAPLPEAVARVARRWSEQSGVPATLTVTGEVRPLPPAIEVTLLRAVQEALANVSRHAQAGTVETTLSFVGNEVILDVHDDGRGFHPTVSAPNGEGGFGLVALRQRVAAAGGEVGIESRSGEGTTITVRFPCPVEVLR